MYTLRLPPYDTAHLNLHISRAKVLHTTNRMAGPVLQQFEKEGTSLDKMYLNKSRLVRLRTMRP